MGEEEVTAVEGGLTERWAHGRAVGAGVVGAAVAAEAAAAGVAAELRLHRPRRRFASIVARPGQKEMKMRIGGATAQTRVGFADLPPTKRLGSGTLMARKCGALELATKRRMTTALALIGRRMATTRTSS